MIRRPRTWNEIIAQEGATGLLAGEDIRVEEAYKERIARRFKYGKKKKKI